MKKIFLVYGDPSAHLLACNLVKNLKEQEPDIEIKALGSRSLAEEGVEVRCDLVSHSVVGLFEVLVSYFTFKDIFDRTVQFLEHYKPDCLILIDYPGFNLRLAREAKKLGLKIIYYVSPQVWAWHKSRIKQIKQDVDLMLVIFKFEEEFYQREGVYARFVGYPRTEFVKPEISKHELIEKYHIRSNGPFIGVMPGSRKTEIKYTLPVILKAMRLIKKEYPYTTVILIKAEKIPEKFIKRFTAKFKDLDIVVIEEEKYAAISLSDALVVCSGTSTLEVALLEKPFIIVYKLYPMTYHIVKNMVKVPFIGMVNILLRRSLIPELIQEKLNPQNIYRYMISYLDNIEVRETAITGLRDLKKILEGKDSFQKTAKIILEEINKPPYPQEDDEILHL